MNNNEVDRFLLANKAEIRDNGFSERVMRRLPDNPLWQQQMMNTWKCICIVTAFLVCYFTDILGTIIIDIKAFIVTLPFETAGTQWFYVLGIPMLVMWGMIAAVTGRLMKN